jgi:hypothetical protein
MASFLKRVRKLVGAGGDDGLRVDTADGSVSFTDDEASTYRNLFRAMDIRAEGNLGGDVAASFFRQSNLTQEQLREVRAFGPMDGSRNGRTHEVCEEDGTIRWIL